MFVRRALHLRPRCTARAAHSRAPLAPLTQPNTRSRSCLSLHKTEKGVAESAPQEPAGSGARCFGGRADLRRSRRAAARRVRCASAYRKGGGRVCAVSEEAGASDGAWCERDRCARRAWSLALCAEKAVAEEGWSPAPGKDRPLRSWGRCAARIMP